MHQRLGKDSWSGNDLVSHDGSSASTTFIQVHYFTIYITVIVVSAVHTHLYGKHTYLIYLIINYMSNNSVSFLCPAKFQLLLTTKCECCPNRLFQAIFLSAKIFINWYCTKQPCCENDTLPAHYILRHGQVVLPTFRRIASTP